jgi:2-polyprenyl-3-methyl-5-hydroxy-6-metoxy-1,4-benzoquinol methylase
MTSNELTKKTYWDEMWTKQELRLPSRFSVNINNFRRILKHEIRRGMKVLELGCAPGKHLAWVAANLGADVTGVDYSAVGITNAKRIFERLGLNGDLRCTNIFECKLESLFDLVYSYGLVEHFQDPQAIILKHLEYLKPGGIALVVIPHWGENFYGRLQLYFDPEDLSLHNRSIMDEANLLRFAPEAYSKGATVSRSGRFTLGPVYFEKRLPHVLARCIKFVSYGIGILQPFDIQCLSPYLVLRIERNEKKFETS